MSSEVKLAFPLWRFGRVRLYCAGMLAAQTPDQPTQFAKSDDEKPQAERL